MSLDINMFNIQYEGDRNPALRVDSKNRPAGLVRCRARGSKQPASHANDAWVLQRNAFSHFFLRQPSRTLWPSSRRGMKDQAALGCIPAELPGQDHGPGCGGGSGLLPGRQRAGPQQDSGRHAEPFVCHSVMRVQLFFKGL